jgi:glycerol-3-phosphate dehydrogenase (NAD(P)+)
VKIGLIGAGGWGTALAKVLSENRHDVVLWCREEEVRASIQDRRENTRFLRGIALPASIRVTASLEEAARGAEVFVLAVPSPYVRSVATQLAPWAPRASIVVSAT